MTIDSIRCILRVIIVVVADDRKNIEVTLYIFTLLHSFFIPSSHLRFPLSLEKP